MVTKICLDIISNTSNIEFELTDETIVNLDKYTNPEIQFRFEFNNCLFKCNSFGVLCMKKITSTQPWWCTNYTLEDLQLYKKIEKEYYDKHKIEHVRDKEIKDLYVFYKSHKQ